MKFELSEVNRWDDVTDKVVGYSQFPGGGGASCPRVDWDSREAPGLVRRQGDDLGMDGGQRAALVWPA